MSDRDLRSSDESLAGLLRDIIRRLDDLEAPTSTLRLGPQIATVVDGNSVYLNHASYGDALLHDFDAPNIATDVVSFVVEADAGLAWPVIQGSTVNIEGGEGVTTSVDITGKITIDATATGGGGNRHALEFFIDDYATEADPLAAVIAAMEAAYPGPEPGANWWWASGDDASNRFLCHISPGKWGVAAQPYVVNVPVTFRGPATAGPRYTAGALLSGDFTLGAGRSLSIAFEDLYLEGVHTNNVNELRVERCFFTDDTNYAGRGTSDALLTCTGGNRITIRECYTYVTDDRPLIGMSGYYEQILIEDVDHSRGLIVTTGNASGGITVRNTSCGGSFGGTAHAIDLGVSNPFGAFGVDVQDCSFGRGAVRMVTSSVGISGLRFERNTVNSSGYSAAGIEIDTTGSTSGGPTFTAIDIVGNHFNSTLPFAAGAAIDINLRGGALVRVVDNTCGFDANGKAIYVAITAQNTAMSAIVRGNRLNSAWSITQAPIDVRNFGMVTVTDNQIRTGVASNKAVEVTNCARGIIAQNVTSAGGTFTQTGSTVLIVNNW